MTALEPRSLTSQDVAPIRADDHDPLPSVRVLPRASARRSSPLLWATFGLLAGVGAMVLGGLAVVDASRSQAAAPPAAPERPAKPAVRDARVGELEAAVRLMARPTTRRVAFAGSGGRLVLLVGSGGRAALLLNGLGVAPDGKRHHAWLTSGRRVRRIAIFEGSERLVPLRVRLGARSRVVLTTQWRGLGAPAGRRLVARLD
jgi:hypothetical protein